MRIDPSKKAEYIRKANTLFNSDRQEEAGQIYKALNYRDGLIRMGDYLYFDKHQPLRAFGYYRQANHEPMIDKIHAGFQFALKCWLWETPEEKAQKSEKKNSDSSTESNQRRPPRLGDDYATPT